MHKFVLIGLLCFAAVFFGGVHVWSRSVLILAIFACFPLFLWMQSGRRTRVGAEMPLMLDPLTVMGIFFMAWGLLSLVPAPVSVIALLSPEAARLWSAAFAAGDAGFATLSLYPFMTREALLLTAAFLFYYWMALYGLVERKHLEGVIIGILALGVFESLYGLVQLAAGMNTVLWWENPYSRNFVTGTFINRNHLAGFLAMTICLGIGYLWSVGHREEPETRRQRKGTRLREKLMQAAGVLGYRGVLVMLALALMLAALLGSASRGGAISLVSAIVFMGGLILARSFRSGRGFLIMALFALVLTYVGYVATERLVGRLATFGLGMEDRIAMARDAWTMGKDFPVTGSGPGTFEYVFPRYQSVHLDKVVDHAHNDWVQLLAEYGWPGLLAVLSTLAIFLVLAVGRWRNRHDGFVVGIGIGGIGAVVAIAVHSLSDFNLRIPAMPLLLALILAVTWRSLHLGRQGKEGYEGPAMSIRLARNRMQAALALLIVLLAGSAWFVIQAWRADAMARTYRNSTLPYRDPTPERLRQARNLAPGNAAYWLWTAERLAMKPEEKEALLNPEEKRRPDPRRWLPAEGLRRNPTSWQTWREMAWSRYFGSDAPGEERSAEVERALAFIKTAASLRQADNRLKLESGIIALAAQGERPAIAVADDWQKPFREVVQQNPKMAGVIADLVVLHLGAKGAATMADFLPPDGQSHLHAAAVLLDQSHLEAGMDLIRRGEQVRGEQVEGLWQEFRERGEWLDAKNSPLLRKAAALDPEHPGVLLARGETLRAMQAMERRGEPATKWEDPRVLFSRIEADLAAKKGDPVRQSYYLGLLAAERGDPAGALRWLNRTLSLNSQHFLAWLRLRDLLQGRVASAADRIQLESLEKRIHLYAMDRIMRDAWRWSGKHSGNPTWRAPFRVDRGVEKASVRFSGERGTVWALYVNGRFVAVWKGPAWEGEVSVAIPPGEHEFGLMTWSRELAGEGKTLPFLLEISWE